MCFIRERIGVDGYHRVDGDAVYHNFSNFVYQMDPNDLPFLAINFTCFQLN